MNTKKVTSKLLAGIFYLVGFTAIYHFIFDRPILPALFSGILFAIAMVAVDTFILEKLWKKKEQNDQA